MSDVPPQRSAAEPDGQAAGYRYGRWVAIGALVAAATWVIYLHAVVEILPFDDAFITYRYAENLATGRGAVYNPGERVFGASTPLYLLWLTALRLGLPGTPLAESAVRANAIWLVFAGVASYLLLGRLTRSRALAAFGALSLMLNRSMLVVSTGGMESFLFVGLTLSTMLALAAVRPLASGGLAGLSLLTRPEGAVLLPLVVAGSWRRSGGLSRVLGAWLAVVGAWVIVATAYYGSPVPHSLIAKLRPIYTLPAGTAVDLVRVGLTGFLTDVWRPGLRDALSVMVWALLAAAALAGALTAQARRRSAWAPSALLLGILALYLVGNPMVFPWYWPHLFVPALLTILVGLPLLGESVGRGLRARADRWRRLAAALPAALAVSIAAVSLLAPYARGPRGPRAVLSDVGGSPERLRIVTYRRVAERLNGLAAADDRVAAAEIGSLGYYYRGRVLDGCGLVTPEALPFLPVRESERQHQANGAIAVDFVRALQPEWVVTMPVFAREGLLSSEWFQEHYLLAGRAPLPRELWSDREVLVLRRRGSIEPGPSR